MRDLHRTRTARADVREERLRATAGLREPPSLSSWRGRSGRRYVVGIHQLCEAEVADVVDAVVIAVQRAGDGEAAVLDVSVPAGDTSRRARLRWLSRMRSRGATEMHVHRLAESDAERKAVVDDLVGVAS